MLKKKGGAGFKPKAPVRRNAAGPSSQGRERQASKTPAPPPAIRHPTPTSGLSQVPVAESATSLPSSSSQIEPTHVAADKTPTVAVLGEPATAPSRPLDSQATQTAVDVTTSANGPEEIPPVAQSKAASHEPEPTGSADKSKDAATSAGPSPKDASSSQHGAETAAPSQPPESAITTPSVPDITTAQSPRSSRRAAAAHRVPLPTAAPGTSTRAPETTTASIVPRIPTPASTTPQPVEPTQRDATAEPTGPQARQAATPPTESLMDIQESIEATGDADNNEHPAAPPKAKRAAPRKRKPAAAADTAETEGDAAAPAPKKPRRKKAAPPATAAEVENQTEGEGEGGSQPPAPAPKKRAPRKPRAQSTQSGGEGSATGSARRGGGFRHRSPTPEDAEEQEVDQRQVKMGDLVKDLRIGKKFSRHDELLERQRMKKLKAKMGAAAAAAALNDNDSAAGSKAGTPAPGNGESSAPNPALADGAPQFQIIDGQIVVNQSTLQFDRHAAAAREAGELEEEVEDDFTHHTTSNTYMKKVQKPNHWTEIETETFYRGLRMWGTDFALLCKMFPGKNRRHIKLKFNREERAHPAKVNAALVGEKKVSIDLDEYKSHTGLEYKSVDEIEAEQARVEEEFEAEQMRAEEEAAEEARKKKEELFGKKEEMEKKGRGVKGRRKKDAGGFGLGG